jgi:hypothetical protein
MPDVYLTLGAPKVTGRIVLIVTISSVIVLVTACVAALLTAGSPRAASGRAAAAERRSQAIRITFTAAQCALAVVLAIGAAMLGQSYWNLMRQDIGYDANAITLRVYFPSRGAALAADVDQALERVRAIPSVRAAGASTVVLGEMTSWSTFEVLGRNVEVHTRRVTPGFFDAAGIRLREGRLLSSADSQARSIVVNDAFVRAFLVPGSVLGTIISERRMPPSTIVGVVHDVFDRNLTTTPEPRLYRLWEPDPFGLVFTVRSSSEAAIAGEAVRRAIKNVHPRASVGSAETIGRRLADTVRDRTFAALVLMVFGAAAAGIALAGVAAMVAFTVARRSREIAIRMVVGAGRHDIRTLVLREAGLAATIGGTAGLISGRWLSTFLESQVYGLEAGNWLTVLVATTVVIILTTVVALRPARRALAMSPTLALRAE